MNVPFDQLFTWLKDHKITEVECVVSDLTGIARGKIAPTNKFLHERGMRLPESVLLQTVTGDFVDDDIYYDLLDPADIDMVCVRENSEGEYAGTGGRVHRGTPHEVAEQTGIFTRTGIERIVRYGFKVAQSRPRKLLASATKSNAFFHGASG